MKKVKIAVGILLALGLILSSCATGNVAQTEWAEYTVIPSKNYTVVGAIVLRGSGFKTLNADLMEKAISMGAHDIINVRVDYESSLSEPKILAASAVAIKYNDQTLVDKWSNTTTADGKVTTSSGETYVVKKSNNGLLGGDTKRKKFLGIF
jgi:hypothetical protein